MEKYEELKKKVRNLISQNKTEKAIELLAKESLSAIDKKLILLNGRLKKLKDDETFGVIDDDEVRQEINKINLSILDLAEEIEMEPKKAKEAVVTPAAASGPPDAGGKNKMMMILIPAIIGLLVIALFALKPWKSGTAKTGTSEVQNKESTESGSQNSSPASFVDGQTYRIKTAQPGVNNMCLDILSTDIGKNGSTVQMWDCHDTHVKEYDNLYGNQYWQFERVGNEYKIRSLVKNVGVFYLDAEMAYHGQDGRKVHLWEPTSGANQLWKVSKNDDGTFRIQTADPHGNNMSLDLALSEGNLGKNGGLVHLWTTSTGANQKWEIVPVN